MCGICAYVPLCKKKGMSLENRYADFLTMKGRGPDMSVFQTYNNVSIGFHRLAIMDPTFRSNQPYIFEDADRTLVFICNGEIYNFKDLIRNHCLSLYTNSDCATIPMLYMKYEIIV